MCMLAMEREREREQKEVGFKCVSVRVCATHVFEKEARYSKCSGVTTCIQYVKYKYKAYI